VIIFSKQNIYHRSCDYFLKTIFLSQVLWHFFFNEKIATKKIAQSQETFAQLFCRTFIFIRTLCAADDIKFRANAAATISWGGSTTFPTGTATTSGAGNITVPAGTYSVSFNRVTGAYSFSVLSTTSFDKSRLALYPNPTTTTFAINGAFEKVQVYSITGQLVKTFTKTSENQNLTIADLNSGVYFVKAVDASNTEKTSKLIKQ
jgi:hypothetical protein